MPAKVISLEDRRKRFLSARQEAALDSPLPPFPDAAWRGVFGEYRELMNNDPAEPGTPISECPEAFHFANILAVASAEMGHGVRLDEGSAVYGNFFIFCCGKTGTKKSTAGDLAEDYIYSLFPDEAQSYVITSISSGEGLIRTLMQHPQLLLRYDEGKDLFATAARNGSRIEPQLNKAFNLRRMDAIVKKSRDSLLAENYYFSMVLNATPEHVLLDMSEALFKGGLLNRFLVFAASPTKVVKHRMGTPNYEQACALARKIYEKSKAWIPVTKGQRGEIRVGFTPDALAVHKAWYDRNTLAAKGMSDLQASPLTRLDGYSKKVAMTYAFYEEEPNERPMITAAQMESSLALVDYNRACMEWITEAWTGQRTVWQQAQALAERRIEEFLLKNGCMSERDLYRAMHMSYDECGKAVDALVGLGAASVSGGRPRGVHLIGYCVCDQ